jgi:hypothetical protein
MSALFCDAPAVTPVLPIHRLIMGVSNARRAAMNMTNCVKGMPAFVEALRRHALNAGCDLNVANALAWRLLVEEGRRTARKAA